MTSDDIRRAIGTGWNIPKDSELPAKLHRYKWMEALIGLTSEERQIVMKDVIDAGRQAKERVQ